MSLDIEGIEQLKLRLRRLGSVDEVANTTLEEMAVELGKKAHDMAPIEHGDLKEAIKVRRVAGQGALGRFQKGVYTYEIYIDNNQPVTDQTKLKHGVDTVGEYAWMVHEYMGWASQPNPQFMPSDLSVQMGEAAGVEAGGKFLERATAALEQKFNARLASVILKHIGGFAALDI